MKQKVLFICTGNACRSQMAEGILRQYLGDRYKSCSAGVKPFRLSSRAVQVMQEIGIDISKHYSKSISDPVNINPDIVITLCDYAVTVCPPFSENIQKIHWSVSDPFFAVGNREESLNAFRTVRDEIKERILNELKR